MTLKYAHLDKILTRLKFWMKCIELLNILDQLVIQNLDKSSPGLKISQLLSVYFTRKYFYDLIDSE